MSLIGHTDECNVERKKPRVYSCTEECAKLRRDFARDPANFKPGVVLRQRRTHEIVGRLKRIDENADPDDNEYVVTPMPNDEDEQVVYNDDVEIELTDSEPQQDAVSILSSVRSHLLGARDRYQLFVDQREPLIERADLQSQGGRRWLDTEISRQELLIRTLESIEKFIVTPEKRCETCSAIMYSDGPCSMCEYRARGRVEA